MLEQSTLDESDSDVWRKERKPRITASVVGNICMRKAQFEGFAKRLYDPPPFSDFVKQKLKYGKMYEKIARDKYVQYLRNINRPVLVSDADLVVNPTNFWLGCSPDGKVTDPMVEQHYGLCEIKCPHEQRDEDLLFPCQRPTFLLFNDNGQPRLKQNHNYYYQVQAQMALTETEWVDFVVYTSKSMVIQRVLFNDQFWDECARKLKKFYSKYYLGVIM